MCKPVDKMQTHFPNFYQSMRFKENPVNCWIQMEDKNSWDLFEVKNDGLFSSATGNSAKLKRMALLLPERNLLIS